MKSILLFGAGKSASTLISFLEERAADSFRFKIADAHKQLIISKLKAGSTAEAIELDVKNDIAVRKELISEADIVISMMPPFLHQEIAMDCLDAGKHLLTASYTADEIKVLDAQVKAKDLLFLCEMGLDPGIDHMSAMKLIDEIHAEGGKITSFKSHCGGLIAPASDDNPWHYKISWNPANVVNAGKAGAIFREENDEKSIPYRQLFNNEGLVETGNENIGLLGIYPNRNSLPYIDLYGLGTCHTFVRTTLRYPAFLRGWSKLIALGFTDETPAYDTNGMSLKDFFEKQLSLNNVTGIVDEADKDFVAQLENLGASDDKTLINRGMQSANDILLFAMEQKWKLKTGDKDLVVMVHELEYLLNGRDHKVISRLILEGEDSVHTAMSKTVGLPLGIAALLLLEDKISLRGVHIPVLPEIYVPVLASLQELGIRFHDEIL